MIRTIVSLHTEEKAWLDEMAQAQHASRSQIVRTAIRAYHQQKLTHTPTEMEILLKRTQGIWQKEDGLKYQLKIRKEW